MEERVEDVLHGTAVQRVRTVNCGSLSDFADKRLEASAARPFALRYQTSRQQKFPFAIGMCLRPLRLSPRKREDLGNFPVLVWFSLCLTMEQEGIGAGGDGPLLIHTDSKGQRRALPPTPTGILAERCRSHCAATHEVLPLLTRMYPTALCCRHVGHAGLCTSSSYEGENPCP